MEVQTAADLVVGAAGDEDQGSSALELFASIIMERFREQVASTATNRMFSPELPLEIQRFSAAWLMWILSKDAMALSFGNAERLTVALCDRAIPEIYPPEITEKHQTFEKLQALESFVRSVMTDARRLMNRSIELDRIQQYRGEVLRFLNHGRNRVFLEHVLPWSLVDSNTNSMFYTVIDYAENRDVPTSNPFDSACETCAQYRDSADHYGSQASSEILVALARTLLSSITQEEEKNRPHLRYSAMEKRYPFKEPGSEVVFYITVENSGTGPAKDLKLETLHVGPSLTKTTDPPPVMNLRPGDSEEFRIAGRVSSPSDQVDLRVRFSWRRNNGQDEHKEQVFAFLAQKDDVDWSAVSSEQPYDHTAPVTSTDNLYGREAELAKLVGTASTPSVGSAYLFGQKRVGKTSLAYALAEQLRVKGDGTGKRWVVIYAENGAYVMSDAASTLTRLGEFLFGQIRQKMEPLVPNIMQYPVPDFTKGLAPLSIFIDHVLDTDHEDSLRFLFILDEFDDLPIEFLRRTPIAVAFYQPIRQISSRHGCGFLLVGGENMDQLMVIQGDRLNKFESIRIDYLNRPEFWDLIREPVKHWLTITDEALELLYDGCSGNPFYAKLLAAELHDSLVARQDSNASRKDVEDAIHRRTSEIAANSFAHFWTDGILPDSEQLEKIQTARRFVLTAAGQVLRDGELLTRNRIVERARAFRDPTLLEADYHAALDDLTVRNIITVNDEQIDMKMPVFRDWLMHTGGAMILPDSMQRIYVSRRQEEQDRHKVTDDEIFNLCSNIGDRGRSVETQLVRNWLSRFDNGRDQRLMFTLLSGLNIYGRELMRRKMREGFGIVVRDMPTPESVGGYPRHGGMLVSCLDESTAKGGYDMCRLFYGENGLGAESFVYVGELGNAIRRRQKVKRIVLIDDFVGTGGTLVRQLKSNMDTLRRANEKDIRVVVLAVIGFDQGHIEIREFIRREQLDAEVYFCDQLGDEYKAFSDRSRVFQDPTDREHAKEIAERKGVILFPEHPLGYSESQALVVFSDHCPNNSLPILWSDRDGWPTLFPRLGV